MPPIKVAIAGIGNCASALVQGIEYYRTRDTATHAGLMHPDIGGWKPSDVEVVAAFDVDYRKVGHPLEEAIFAAPNCTKIFQPALPASGVRVQMGPILDGVAEHMANYDDSEAFRLSDEDPVVVAEVLRSAGAEIFICYLRWDRSRRHDTTHKRASMPGSPW